MESVEMNEWQRAIDDELVMTFLGTTDTPEYSKPSDALTALILWHTDVALDPAVSLDARRLLERGFEAGWKAAAEWAERDDLKADIGSKAYEHEQEIAFGEAYAHQIHDVEFEFP